MPQPGQYSVATAMINQGLGRVRKVSKAVLIEAAAEGVAQEKAAAEELAEAADVGTGSVMSKGIHGPAAPEPAAAMSVVGL